MNTLTIALITTGTIIVWTIILYKIFAASQKSLRADQAANKAEWDAVNKKNHAEYLEYRQQVLDRLDSLDKAVSSIRNVILPCNY